MWSSFSQVVDTSSDVEWYVQGSIAINNANAVGSTKSSSGGEYYTDVAGIKVGGGVRFDGNTTANRLTLANVGDSQFTYPGGISNYDTTSGQANSSQASFGFLRAAYGNLNSAGSLNNSIFNTIQGQGVVGAQPTGDYINSYSIGSNDFSVTHHITTNPHSSGLLYPIRVESGSALATGGSGSGQIGANITQILGPDGAEYGASGYNAPQGSQGSLWPWPLEAWVKAQMAAMDTTIGGNTMPPPTRGFCASGNGLYGGPITLTSYIWESLGNALPASIYGTATLASPTGLHVVQ
jgi:hypothetical protein